MPSKKDSKSDSISIIIGKMGPPPKKSEASKKFGISVDGKKAEEDIEAAMMAEEEGEGESVCPHCGQAMQGETNEEGDESITPPKKIDGSY